MTATKTPSPAAAVGNSGTSSEPGKLGFVDTNAAAGASMDVTSFRRNLTYVLAKPQTLTLTNQREVVARVTIEPVESNGQRFYVGDKATLYRSIGYTNRGTECEVVEVVQPGCRPVSQATDSKRDDGTQKEVSYVVRDHRGVLLWVRGYRIARNAVVDRQEKAT